MNWQDINTAPKDGTEILICMPGGQSDHYYVVFWDHDSETWQSRDSDEILLTTEDINACHLRPMWCELEPCPSSLCFTPCKP